MSAVYLLTCVLAAVRCIFLVGAVATAKGAVADPFPQVATVFVSYDLTPSCRTFLQQQQQRYFHLQQSVFRRNVTNAFPMWLRDVTVDPTAEVSIPPVALRHAMLDVFEKEITFRGKHVTPSLSRQSEFTFGLYDITQFTFQQQHLRDLGLRHERHEITFQWFKYVEIDRVVVPVTADISIARWLDRLRSLPCVAFARPNEHKPIEEEVNMTSPTLPLLVDALTLSPPQERPVEGTTTGIEAPVPNDPHYIYQKWYLDMMNVPAAWALWRGPVAPEGQMTAHQVPLSSSDGIIAVTDTGCDITHPDIQQRLWRNPNEICDNGIDDDGNGYVDDCYGWNFVDRNADLTESLSHGTPVSGAIGAATHNGFGTAGVCWTCQLMCLRIGHTFIDLGAFLEAMNYALVYGAKIVNFSAGGGESVMERWALKAAMARDVVVVVAAGNEGCDLDGYGACTALGFPARYSFPNMLAVGALNRAEKRSSFSNFGEASVDVFAPGEDILLLNPMYDLARPMFVRASGTSFSTPLVTGVVALLRSRYPRLRYSGVIQAIRDTCRPVKDLSGRQMVNGQASRSKRAAVCAGVIDAHAALVLAEKLTAKTA